LAGALRVRAVLPAIAAAGALAAAWLAPTAPAAAAVAVAVVMLALGEFVWTLLDDE
jgi:hypothetical protein